MMSAGTERKALEAFDVTLNHFERLGLSPSVEVDREVIETNYLERSARVHPDKHSVDGDAAQRNAMEHASALNIAYRVIRDTVERAEYLVKLAGVDLDSSDVVGGAPKPSQAFLIDMIERREGLEEAVAGGVDALEDLRDELEDEASVVLKRALAAIDAGNILDAAEELVTRRYLARLGEEVETQIEGASAHE